MVINCPQLEIVFLRRCELVDDTAIAHVALNCKNISQLNLEGCNKITDIALEFIAKNSSKLRSLNVSKTQVCNQSVNFYFLFEYFVCFGSEEEMKNSRVGALGGSVPLGEPKSPLLSIKALEKCSVTVGI